MKSQQRVLKVLHHEEPDRVPVYEALIDKPIVKQVLGLDVWSWGLSAKDIVSLHKTLRLDAILLPALSWKPFDTFNKKLRIAELTEPRKQEVYANLETMDTVAKYAHNEGLAVCGYSHGCFDVAYEGLGFDNFMVLLIEDFDYIDALIQRLYEYHKNLIELMVQTCIDWVQIGDDVAYKNGLFIKRESFLKLWYEREKTLAKVVHDSGKPLEFHTDGNIEAILSELIGMGVDIINPVEPYSNNILELKRKYGRQIGFRGNLDIGGVLAFGTPQQTYEQTRDLVLNLKSGGNFVCSSSHSISPGVKYENYKAMVDAVEEFGWYN
jgi:uroporphyrinogen-III decarboxylase